MSFKSHTFAFAIGAFAAHTFARAQQSNAVQTPFATEDDEMNLGNGFDSASLGDSVLGEEDPGAADGSVDPVQTSDARFGGSAASTGSEPFADTPAGLRGGA